MAVGWSTTDRNGFTVGGTNNLTVTCATTTGAVRSATSHSSGKWYFEYTWTPVGGADTDPTVGIASDNAAIAIGALYPGLGSPSQSVGMAQGNNQEVYYNGTSGAQVGHGLASGGVVSVCVDLDNHTIWFTDADYISTAGGAGWNLSATANPATNTGGLAFSFTDAATFIACGVSGGGKTGSTVTLNTGGSAFLRSPPSGFNAWDTWSTAWAGSATFTNASTFTATAIPTQFGSGTFAGAGGLTANPKKLEFGRATLAGAGALTASALTPRQFATATFINASTFTANATHTPAGVATFTNASTFTANASVTSPATATGSATFAGAGNLGGTSPFSSDFSSDFGGAPYALTPQQFANATFTNASTWAANAAHTPAGAAILAGAGAFAASATPRSNKAAAATFAGTGTLAADTDVIWDCDASFTNASTFVVTAVHTPSASAALTGAGGFWSFFGRASSATYIDATGTMQLAAVDEPRFTYDTAPGNAFLGQLAEDAATNVLTNGNNPVLANGGHAATVNNSSDIARLYAPAQVSKCVWTGTGDNNVGTYATPTLTAGQAYQGSVWLWIPSTSSFSYVRLSQEGGGRSGTGNANLALTDQWQRLTVTGNAGATTATSNLVLRPSGTDPFYVSCWQLEAGTLTTSYIPTSSGAATRAPDVSGPFLNAAAGASMPGSGAFAADTGLFLGAAASFSGAGTLAADTDLVLTVSAPFAGAGGFIGAASHTPAGSATLAGTGALAAGPVQIDAVNVGLGAIGGFSAQATRAPAGAAQFAGSGTLAASAAQVVAVSPVSFTASGSLTSVPAQIDVATAAYAGTGTFALAGGIIAAATVSFAGAGALNAAAVRTPSGAASFNAAATFTATPVQRQQAAASFTGGGGFTLTAVQIDAASAAFPALGALFTNPVVPGQASVGFTGAGGFSAGAIHAPQGVAVWNGAGNLGGSVNPFSPDFSNDFGAAPFPAVLAVASISFAATAGWIATAAHTPAASAAFAAAGSLGNITVTARLAASALFPAGTSLSANAAHTPTASAAFSGAGGLNGAATAILQAQAAFGASGALTAQGIHAPSGAALLAASGAFSAGLPAGRLSASATLGGNGVLAAASFLPGLFPGTATFAAAATLTADAEHLTQGNGSFLGAGGLSAAPAVVRVGSVQFSANAVLVVTGPAQRAAAQALVAAQGTLTAATIAHLAAQASLAADGAFFSDGAVGTRMSGSGASADQASASLGFSTDATPATRLAVVNGGRVATVDGGRSGTLGIRTAIITGKRVVNL